MLSEFCCCKCGKIIANRNGEETVVESYVTMCMKCFNEWDSEKCYLNKLELVFIRIRDMYGNRIRSGTWKTIERVVFKEFNNYKIKKKGEL